MMLARVDGNAVSPDALWWPAMNFDQFRWDAPIGRYELEFARPEFVQRLTAAYEQCVRELREDDSLIPEEASLLREAGYPPLNALLEHPAARFEVFNVYLYEDVFEAFIPHPMSAAAQFMINSVDEVSAVRETVALRGRGYHARPPGC